MNHNMPCEIVRDLIPLVVDGAACKESRILVEKHALECAGCHQMMDDIRAEIKTERMDEENTKFIKFCQKMRKALSWHLLIKAFVAIVLVAGILVGGIAYTHNQMYNASMEIKPTEYSAAVDQEGFFMLKFKAPKNHKYFGDCLNFDQGICYYAPKISAWPQFLENLENNEIESYASTLQMKDGMLMYIEYEKSIVLDEESGQHVSKWEPRYTPIQELRLGTKKDYEVVYRAGDALPVVHIERGTY